MPSYRELTSARVLSILNKFNKNKMLSTMGNLFHFNNMTDLKRDISFCIILVFNI